jgi:D-glycero-D-manno-heptose 1,7-bisphosphate phosphatase
MKKRAVFLDRDGVLTQPIVREGKAYSPRTISEFRILPEVKSAIDGLHKQGFLLFVITNQPDIARKKMRWEDLHQMNDELIRELNGSDRIRAVMVCPHDDQDGCDCRKPKPGMLLKAAKEWDVDLETSFLVGDRQVDISAGAHVRCKTVIINASYNRDVEADFRARNLREARDWILKQ